MKKSLLIAASLLLTFSLRAQITLDYSNAPSDAQCQIPDTMDRIKMNTLPDVSPKANATWDLTTATDSSIYSYFLNRPANSTVFPSATFIIPRQYIINAGLRYNFEAMRDVSTAGIVTLGEHIDRQAIPLVSITTNPNDSLIFITQDIIYNAPEHKIKYPCTMGTKWKDSVVLSTKFNLTVTSSGLNNTPGARKTTRITNYEVKGWGKMRVKDYKGNPTGYMDVLVIDRTEITSDSFFLGGNPAPPSLLAAFGLTQGQQLPKYKRFYFRAGEYVGLLEIDFDDAAFIKVEQIRKHSQRLKPTSVTAISKEQISIYPNPVTNSSFTVKLSVPYNELSYELYNITGQNIASSKVSAGGNISLPDNVPTGTYFVRIRTESGAQGVKQLNIIK